VCPLAPNLGSIQLQKTIQCSASRCSGALLTSVSIMSHNGVPTQEISDTVGHKSTHVTETVYRHMIAPAIRGGATIMDGVFGA
jgi:hypothetical protein